MISSTEYEFLQLSLVQFRVVAGKESFLEALTGSAALPILFISLCTTVAGFQVASGFINRHAIGEAGRLTSCRTEMGHSSASRGPFEKTLDAQYLIPLPEGGELLILQIDEWLSKPKTASSPVV